MGGLGLIIVLLTPWLIGVYDAQGYSFFENFILLHNVERFSGNLHGHGGHPLLFVGNAVSLVALQRASDCGSNTNPRILGLSYQSICADLGSHCSSLVSSSGTQLPHYILYSTAPLFVLYARVLPTLNSRLWALPGLFVPVSILGFGLLHHLLPEPNISGIRSSSLCCFS